MKLFEPGNRTRSPEHERIYGAYEIWYTSVDFAAALAFVVGSTLFFFKSTQIPAIWLFLIGSICFALKPTIRLLRELKYVQMGKLEEMGRRDRH